MIFLNKKAILLRMAFLILNLELNLEKFSLSTLTANGLWGEVAKFEGLGKVVAGAFFVG